MNKRMIRVPEGLPNCQLINTLVRKANARHDITFNYIDKLENLRQIIVPIVGQINILFPEYTPHDENYHLKSLFYIADTILGKRQIGNMNSSELFILACSLYAHDWGMAVSQAEKTYLITGQRPKGMSEDQKNSLKWDRELFCRFATQNNISLTSIRQADEINVEAWREYVRQSHAIRSSIRVSQHFELIDTGIANATKRVCESHVMDFNELENPLYPITFSVLRDTVNIRALAIYLRLIDLFDLAHDRTPYVLWKHVMPRNYIAKIEWSKHRALQPVTCLEYLQGRQICIDGSTDDHEVWAALEDFKYYCEFQLSKSNDLLSRMKDTRHSLDIYALNWRVVAQGFNPVSVQFEYDRETMFKILSDEIYQGDRHIFLRELLQNSIDAIRFRQAIFRKRQGFDPTDLGIIHVKVEHKDNGDAIVTWKDNGIGMDEYIVKNYFAVAGKSYYRSLDFEREGVQIDPISRFGIGILSCFMVADSIEVETYKDPYLSPDAKPLRISIPAINRQFRVEVLKPEGFRIGTTVKVYVKGEKVRVHSLGISPLNVTDYISAIAGFVEFPILIEDGQSKTVVLHPFANADKAKAYFGEDFRISQLSLNYSWNEEIIPQDLELALRILSESKFDLVSDLNIENCEGKLSYLVPSEESTDFSGSGLGQDVEIIEHNDPELIGKRIQWSKVSPSHGKVLSRSAAQSSLSVYKDGILVPRGFKSSNQKEFNKATYLWVNIIKSRDTKLDLSRTEIVEENEDWIDKIEKSRLRRIFDTNLKHLLSLEDSQRLYQLARLILFNKLDPKAFCDIFPKESWPIPFFISNKITMTTYANLPKTIFIPPTAMREEIAKLVDNHFLGRNDYQGILSKWKSDKCLALYRIDAISPKVQSIKIKAIRDCYSFLLGSLYHLSYIRFLKPPWTGNPPLLQTVYERFETPEYNASELFDKLISNPVLLGKSELIALEKELIKFISFGFYDPPSIVSFPNPFSQYYAYGESWLNICNESVGELLRIIARILLAEKQGRLSPIERNQLKNALYHILRKKPSMLHHGQKDFDEWVHELRGFGEFVKTLGFAGSKEIGGLIPSFNEFIPGSFGYLDVSFNFAKPTNRFGEVM